MKPTIAEELFARKIAFWHGATMIRKSETVAAMAGYGSWGHSPDKYAENHWREYLGAARAVIEAR